MVKELTQKTPQARPGLGGPTPSGLPRCWGTWLSATWTLPTWLQESREWGCLGEGCGGSDVPGVGTKPGREKGELERKVQGGTLGNFKGRNF